MHAVLMLLAMHGDGLGSGRPQVSACRVLELLVASKGGGEGEARRRLLAVEQEGGGAALMLLLRTSEARPLDADCQVRALVCPSSGLLE